MKKCRETFLRVFDGSDVPQNTPNSLHKAVEKFPNLTTAVKSALIREFVANEEIEVCS